MEYNKILRIYVPFAIVLVIAAYYFGLFIDLTSDTGKYATIAREMVKSGDYINLKINGKPYLQKPPLMFWLAGLGFGIGGLQNWAFKLFPTLYSLLGIWFTYKLGETLYNRRTGVLAAVMLVTSEVFFLFNMDPHMDMLLQANVTLAIWQLASYMKKRKPSNFIWAFVAVGLAMMSKGAIGAAIPAFALGTHLILKKEFKQLFHAKWLIGILIALVISSPTFIGLYNQFGIDGIKFFFITNNVGRVTGELTGSNTDYFFYLHTILYLTLPWTFLLLFAFFHELKSYVRYNDTQREYYTIGGIWIFFIIASFAKGKAPHYIFTLVPMFLIITAKWIDHYLNLSQSRMILRLFRIQHIMPALLTIVILLFMLYLFPTNKPGYWALFVCCIAMGLFIDLKKTIPIAYRLLLPSILLITNLTIYLNAYALPKAFAYQGSTQAAKIYNENALSNDPIYNYLYPMFELYFYSKNGADKLEQLDDLKLDSEKPTWVFTTQEGMDSIRNAYPDAINKVFLIQHRGMNRLSIGFINPATRQSSLAPTYLIKMSGLKDSTEIK